MNSFSSATSPSKNQADHEVLVNVIVKQKADGRIVATVPGWSELQVEASDRTTALAKLQQQLETHLADSEIVSLAVKLPSMAGRNPWLEMAGVFQNDPQFEQMLEAIENYRQEVDKTTEDNFLQE